MALMFEETCRVCNREFIDIQSARMISDCIYTKCKNKEADALRIQHFDKLDKLTIEQRLRRLEKVQYNNSLVKNTIPYNPNTIYG